jgi:predicted naringenin-chalcone synthase
MRRRHHRLQSGFDRTARVRQEGGNTSQSLLLFGIEDMQDGADQRNRGLMAALRVGMMAG